MPKFILRNVNWTLTTSDLVKYFSKYGQIRVIQRKYDLKTGLPSKRVDLSYQEGAKVEEILKDQHNFSSRLVRVTLYDKEDRT